MHTWRDRRMSTAQQADKAEVAFSEASDRSPLVPGDKKPYDLNHCDPNPRERSTL